MWYLFGLLGFFCGLLGISILRNAISILRNGISSLKNGLLWNLDQLTAILTIYICIFWLLEKLLKIRQN